MIKPTDSDGGRKVIYVPTHAKGDMGHKDCEEGVLTSWNDKYAFVRYGSDFHSKATDFRDLHWVSTSNMYAIWSEGYAATGESAGAHYHGYAAGISFKEACVNFAKANPAFNTYFDPDRMTYWGCGLFDNEADARKSFG